jgi:hypothetical protein
MLMSDDASPLSLEARQSWTALLLAVCWVAMLRSSSVLFLMVSTGA